MEKWHIEVAVPPKKERLYTISTFRRGFLGKRGTELVQEVAVFKKKNKIWNIYWQKKFINKNVFLCPNYEFKLRSLAKNLVTFKIQNGVLGQKNLILWGLIENPNF